MKIPFSFRRVTLAPGGTLSLAVPPGGRVRVLDGRIWATTGGMLDDVWLKAGEEHVVRQRSLTVIESVGASTVELVPSRAIGAGRVRATGYRSDIPRRACGLAALAMALATFGVLVLLPAKIGPAGRADAVATSPAPAVTARNVAPGPAPRS